MVDKNYIKETFDLIYKHNIYGQTSHSTKVVEEVFNYFDMKHGDTLIDYGCGRGYAANWFQANGVNTIGIDITEKGLIGSIKFKFVKGCLWELPDTLKSKYFFCSDVLAHIPEDKVEDVLDKIKDNTLVGGYFSIADCSVDCLGPQLINRKLHLTSQGFDWWERKVGNKFVVTKSRRSGIRSEFFVTIDSKKYK